MKKSIELNINGELHEIAIHSKRTLLEVLREDLGLTGTKEGCSLGTCGSCTVIVDGEAILSCLTLAESVQGKEILTIEGLAQNGKLHPLQESFVKHGAIQCGFCSPGMILTAKALLDETPHPTEEQVRQGIAGNLCRCTGYVKVVEAIKAVGEGS